MKGKVIKNIITTVGLPVLFGALIFTLWQTKVLHALFGTDEIILPLPTRIGSIIGDNFTNMLPQIASTLIVALGGLVLGSILGYFIGVAGAVFKKWGMGRSDHSIRIQRNPARSTRSGYQQLDKGSVGRGRYKKYGG